MSAEIRKQVERHRTPLRDVKLTTRETIRYGAIIAVGWRGVLFLARGGAWVETIALDDVVRVEGTR